MHVRTHRPTYAYIYLHIHTYICIYINIHIHKYTYTYIHIHIQLYMHIHTYMRIYMHIQTHTYVYIHINIYLNIHKYTYVTHYMKMYHTCKSGFQLLCHAKPAKVSWTFSWKPNKNWMINDRTIRWNMASNENCTFSVYIFRCTFVHFPMVGLLSDQLNL